MPLFAISQKMIKLTTLNMPGETALDNMRRMGLMLLSQSSAIIVPRLSISKDELLAACNEGAWLVCDNLDDALAIARAMIYLKSSEITDNNSVKIKQSPVIFKFDLETSELKKLTANVIHDYCNLGNENDYTLTQGLLDLYINPLPDVAVVVIQNNVLPIELYYLTVKGDCYAVSVNSNTFVNYISNALGGPKIQFA